MKIFPTTAVLLVTLISCVQSACVTDADCCSGTCVAEVCSCPNGWNGQQCCELSPSDEPHQVISISGKRVYGMGIGYGFPFNIMYTTSFDDVTNRPFVFEGVASYAYYMRPNFVGNSDRPFMAIDSASEPSLFKGSTGYNMLVTIPENGEGSKCTTRVVLASTGRGTLDADNWNTPWILNRTRNVIPTSSCIMSPTYQTYNSIHYIAYAVFPESAFTVNYTASKKIGIASSPTAEGPYTVLTEDIGVEGWQPKLIANGKKITLLLHTSSGIIGRYSVDGKQWSASFDRRPLLSSSSGKFTDRIVLYVGDEGLFSSMFDGTKYLVVKQSLVMPSIESVESQTKALPITTKPSGTKSVKMTYIHPVCKQFNAVNWYEPSCWSPAMVPSEQTAVVVKGIDITINSTSVMDLPKRCLSRVFSIHSLEVLGGTVTIIDGTLQLLEDSSIDSRSAVYIKATGDTSCARGVTDPLRNDTIQQSGKLMSCGQLLAGFSPRICGGHILVSGNLTVSGLYASLFSRSTVSVGGNLNIQQEGFLWGATTNFGTVNTGVMFWHTALLNEGTGVLNIGSSGPLNYDGYLSEIQVNPAINNFGTAAVTGGQILGYKGEVATYIGKFINNVGAKLLVSSGVVVGQRWKIDNFGDTKFAAASQYGTTVIHGAFNNYGSIQISNNVAFSYYTCHECQMVVMPKAQLNFMASSRPSNHLVERLSNPGNALSRIEVCTDGLCDKHACPYPMESHTPCTTSSGVMGVQAYNNIADQFCYACEVGSSLDRRISSSAAKRGEVGSSSTSDDERNVAAQSAPIESSSITISNGRFSGGGRVVCSVPVYVKGHSGLRMSDVSLYSTVEYGLDALSGHGPISVEKSAVLSIGINSVLANSHISVKSGGVLHIDSHSEVRALNTTIIVPKGSDMRVDGTLHLDDFSNFKVCGKSSGVGTLHFTSNSAHNIDRC